MDAKISWYRGPLAVPPEAHCKLCRLKWALWSAARTFLCYESLSPNQSWCCYPTPPQRCAIRTQCRGLPTLARSVLAVGHLSKMSDNSHGSCFKKHRKASGDIGNLQPNSGLCSKSSFQMLLVSSRCEMQALLLAGCVVSASPAASLCLNFFIYKMEIIIVFPGVLVRIKSASIHKTLRTVPGME